MKNSADFEKQLLAHNHRLHNENKTLLDKIDELAVAVMQYKKAGDMYFNIQKSCLDNPGIMEAWQEFIAVSKLCDSEIEEKWKGE